MEAALVFPVLILALVAALAFTAQLYTDLDEQVEEHMRLRQERKAAEGPFLQAMQLATEFLHDVKGEEP